MERLLAFDDLPQEALRDYYMRYVVVPAVSNHGEECTHCRLLDRTVECNVHATSMDGARLYEESCLQCVLLLVDRVLDVDPSHTITVEVSEE